MSGSSALRVALVDDHPLFVRGLELLLPSATGGRAAIVGSTGDASAAVALVRTCLPDVVLVDLHMPPPGGIRAIAALRRTASRLRIMAMSGIDDPTVAVEALHHGADGYLPKSSEPEELMPPLLAVLDGWSVLPAAVLTALLGRARGPSRSLANLDAEERRLLTLIAQGRSTVEVAAELHVSERTAKRATAALLRKIRVETRTEAAALAGYAGLLSF